MNKGLMELIETCGLGDAVVVKDGNVGERIELLLSVGLVKPAKALQDRVRQTEQLRRVHEDRYIKITDEKINAFLKLKVGAYNRRRETEPVIKQHITTRLDPSTLIDEIWSNPYQNLLQQYVLGIGINVLGTTTHSLSIRTCDYSNSGPGLIGKFEWKEQTLEEYEGIPPEPVLLSLAEHKRKNLFDYFVVASVQGVPDPIILGRFHQHSDRYYIPGCQWGEDIQMDDLA